MWFLANDLRRSFPHKIGLTETQIGYKPNVLNRKKVGEFFFLRFLLLLFDFIHNRKLYSRTTLETWKKKIEKKCLKSFTIKVLFTISQNKTINMIASFKPSLFIFVWECFYTFSAWFCFCVYLLKLTPTVILFDFSPQKAEVTYVRCDVENNKVEYQEHFNFMALLHDTLRKSSSDFLPACSVIFFYLKKIYIPMAGFFYVPCPQLPVICRS